MKQFLTIRVAAIITAFGSAFTFEKHNSLSMFLLGMCVILLAHVIIWSTPESEVETVRLVSETSLRPDSAVTPDSDAYDVLTREYFEEDVRNGHLMDDDGTGYYSDGKTLIFANRVKCSEVLEGKTRPEFSHVIWFNE